MAIADQSYVSTDCQIIGYNCSSYDNFNQGLCADCGDDGKGCKPMPLDLNFWDNNTNCDQTSVHFKYFLNTGDVMSDNYCLFHYQVNKLIVFQNPIDVYQNNLLDHC